MAQRLICPRGHQWEIADEDARQRPEAILCPICAAPHVTVPVDGASPSPGPAYFDLATMRVAPGSEPGPQPEAPPEPAPDAERVVIPGYEILGVLGRGGMGVVYKARHTALKRIVALKMILTGGRADAEHLNRFRTEGEAVARLHHPNIVQIHDVGEHAGLPYFSLEFVDGESLDKRLAGAPLPPRPAAQLLEALARAMDYAHGQGVIHRDLKPANVLLAPASGLSSAEGAVFLRDTQRGDGPKTEPEGGLKSSRLEQGSLWIPKITDFGLAKQTGVDSGHTQSGSIVGTPSYMAPEQATGRVHEIGPLCDVYSLGAVLYELLTGRPPFRGASVLETLEQVRHQEPVPPRRLQPKVPRDLETICLKCLQKEPRRRYPSAAALADDLHRFLHGEPIRARPIPAWERALKWAHKRPALTALLAFSAAAVIALLALWAGFTAQLREERDLVDQQRRLAEDREHTARRLLYAAHVNLAHRAWHEVQVPRMLELLAEYQKPRDEDPRGLEWYYLWRLGHGELAVLPGHGGAVWSVAYSRDGRRLVSVGSDHTARVWDATLSTPAPLLTLTAGAEIRCAAFSPDGKRLATGTWDHDVTIWDAATGREEFRLRGHQGGIAALAFAPDGRTFASAGADRTVKLWDLATHKDLFTLRGHAQTVQGLAFNPAGDRLASASLDKTVRLWNPATGEELREPILIDSQMRCLSWSPDGKLLAGGGGSQMQPFGEVRLWDADSGAVLTTLRGHRGPVYAVSFSPSGRHLASASHDGTARTWEVNTGRMLQTLRGHSSPVYGVAFRPDGQVLATSGSDGTMRLWDAVVSRDETLLPHEGTVSSLAFSPDGRRLAVAASDSKVVLWSLDNGVKTRPDAVLSGHADKVQCVAFGRIDGAAVLLSGSDDRTIKLWDASGAELRTLHGHTGSVRSVALSPDGRLVASCGTDTTVRLWDAHSGAEVLTLTGHTGPVNAVAFSPDGLRVASAGADQTVRIWNVADGAELRKIPEPLGGFTGVAFSPDGQRLAASHTSPRGGIVKVWNTNGDEELELRGHAEAVNAVAFSPDSQRLATAGDDQTVRLWDAVTGQELLTLTLGPPGGDTWANAVAFSPDGRRLAAGSADRKVRLWTGERE